MSAPDPRGQEPLSRRALRQHRRVDSEAGAPAGETAAAILDLPASSVSPAGLGPLTGQVPRAHEWLTDPAQWSATGRTGARAAGSGVTAPASTGRTITLDRDGVPLGPDGQPLTRRQLRELRERGASGAPAPATADTSSAASPDSGAGSAGVPASSRRADAPEGAPDAVGPDATDGTDEAAAVTRETLAREAARLAERLGASDGGDPAAVDPELLREQERLAEMARRLNETGALATVPAAPGREGVPHPGAGSGGDRPESGSAPVMVVPTRTRSRQDPAPAGEGSGAAPEPVRHRPVEAQHAHGLDSLSASEWSSRERTLLLVAGAVFAVLVIALILALIF